MRSCSTNGDRFALEETCRFLKIQSLEFQEIWQNNIAPAVKTIYEELRKTPMSKFH